MRWHHLKQQVIIKTKPYMKFQNWKHLFNRTLTIEFVSIIITNEHKELLVSQRSNPNKPMYLYWQNPGGKVEKDESYQEAIAREMQEETGLVMKGNFKARLVQTDIYKGRHYDPKRPLQNIKRIVHLYLIIATTQKLEEQLIQGTEPDKFTNWEYKSINELRNLQTIDTIRRWIESTHTPKGIATI